MTGNVLIPTAVAYSSATNTATLTFGSSPLPAGTFDLQVGSSTESNNIASLASAVDVGTLFVENPYNVTAVLGDNGASDVDMYRVNLLANDTLKADLTTPAGSTLSSSTIQLFAADGVTAARCTRDGGRAQHSRLLSLP